MSSYKLPDGREVDSLAEFEKYMKSANITVASDYSDQCMQNIRYNLEKAEKDEAFLDFVQAYKKLIWSKKCRN